MATMNIGKKQLGRGSPVFVVAEIGSNWANVVDCVKSVIAAFDAGADAVKFQHFTQEELYGQYVGRPRDHELPAEWLGRLAERAEMLGIEFMCSAFSPEGVARVDPFVSAHKIASCEATHPGIRDACRKSGKPTFVSSGAVDKSEFFEIMSESWPYGIIPTYCRASYPANDAQPWLWADIAMPRCFSDHSLDVFPAAVHQYGYAAIEKHVNFVGAKGPDAPHSLSGQDFARMVKFLRYQLEEERPPEDIVKYHRRRLVKLPDGTEGYYRVPKGI